MAINFNAPSQVRPYANLGAFPATGTLKTIYIAEDTNYIYRWNGTAYIEISVADLVGYVPYSGATQDVNLGAYDAYVNKLWLYDAVNDNYGSTHYTDGNYHIEDADGHKLLVIEDGFIQLHKTDTIQSNLFTSGLTATRDHYLPDASGTIALTSNLAGYVPTSRTLTINGTTQDLSADRTFTISTGITIGTTAITSGTVGRVLFEGTGNVVSESANLFWDNTNGRLGIGTSTPSYGIDNATTSRVLGSSFNATTSGTLVSGTTTIVNMNYGEVPKTYLTGGTFINGTLQLPTSLRVIATGGGIQFQQQSAPSTNSLLSFGNDTNGVYFGNFLSLGVRFLVGSASVMTLASTTGNVLINTTTDAGYKLDVNGTARVTGQVSALNASNNGIILSNSPTIEFWASVMRIQLSRAGNDALQIGGPSGFAMSTINAGTMIGGVNATSLLASAQLQVDSTTKGFLPPRMTTTQKNAIASPAAGLVVYDSTLNKLCVRTASAWETITSL